MNGAVYSVAAERLSSRPCKGLGRGAIADSAGNGTRHAALETALGAARAGVRASQLTQVQADATLAVTALRAAQQPVASRGADRSRG